MNRTQRFAKNVKYLAQKANRQISYEEATEDVVPYAYCTMVMAMKELTDMTDEDIFYLIKRSQHIWDNWEYGTRNPLEVCEEVTGIWLGNKKTAEALGLEEGIADD